MAGSRPNAARWGPGHKVELNAGHSPLTMWAPGGSQHPARRPQHPNKRLQKAPLHLPRFKQETHVTPVCPGVFKHDPSLLVLLHVPLFAVTFCSPTSAHVYQCSCCLPPPLLNAQTQINKRQANILSGIMLNSRCLAFL